MFTVLKNRVVWLTKSFWRILAFVFVLSFAAFTFVFYQIYKQEVEPRQKRGWSVEKLAYGYHYHHDDYISDEKGYITDEKGRVVLKDIDELWKNDTNRIVTFAQNDYRGYFSCATGKVLIAADRYTMAYAFSEGRAMVSTDDSIYIIDEFGQTIGTPFVNNDRNTDINSFRFGKLPMVNEEGKMGLIDLNGNWLLQPEFSLITLIEEDSFVAADENHWQRRYDYDGVVLDNLVFDEISFLHYKTGETEIRTVSEKSEYGDEPTTYTREDEITELASLRKYITSEGFEGLIDNNGNPVTAPLYHNIEAIAKNLYLCSFDERNEFGVLLNEKGDKVN